MDIIPRTKGYVGLSFRLPEDFVEPYKDRPVNWGFPSDNGFSLGELTFITKYSRTKDARTDSVWPYNPQDKKDFIPGEKERWWEVVRRVVEGTFSIIKNHLGKRFDEHHYLERAMEMYERMFTFKFLPPGRGLWAMGTPLVHLHGKGMALNNCAAVSTRNLQEDPVRPFVFLMDLSMLGVGVGFDTYGKGKVYTPTDEVRRITITDSREGWVRSTALLIGSYLKPGRPTYDFDYSKLRGKGEYILTFGGVSSGPEPLKKLHKMLRRILEKAKEVTSRLIMDIFNLLGKCVVSGNVRRSAELGLGDPYDEDFLSLKDWTLPENAERTGLDGWSGMSNNSVSLNEDHVRDFNFEGYAEQVALNGEPGLFFIDRARGYGRMGQGPDYRDIDAIGTNPCSEQTLHNYEVCNLVEQFPNHHEDLDDYLVTNEISLLYGKAVTLVDVHWSDTNEIIKRNRRIGASMSGVVQFLEERGERELALWMDHSYEHIRQVDREISEEWEIPESIKVTSIKPSGTVSLLAGATPGVHWPVDRTYIRRMRLSHDDPVVRVLQEAGYNTETDLQHPETTTIVEIPVRTSVSRSEKETPVEEKVRLAAIAQSFYADNQVSCTITFHPRDFYETYTDRLFREPMYRSEVKDLAEALKFFEGSLKSISCLPIDANSYPQMPYEGITDFEYEEIASSLAEVDVRALYSSAADGEGEAGCANDSCMI